MVLAACCFSGQPNKAAVTARTADGESAAAAPSQEPGFNHVPELPAGPGLAKACFAAGCFWGVETTLANVPGVVTTAVGYIGGTKDSPTYHQVCRKTTGHAEAVLLTFDPTVVSYATLCNEFWRNHDPTSLNRQGPDHGSQYRSAIFYYNEEQREVAEQTRAQHQKKLSKPIVTQISPAPRFWYAEPYHQKYSLQSYHEGVFRTLGIHSFKDLLQSEVAAKLNGYVTGFAPEEAKVHVTQKLQLTEETRQLLAQTSFGGPACTLH
eukprot:SM000099S25252  [mRNA]  locus=s99:481710:483385:- [translate_table: standard]